MDHVQLPDEGNMRKIVQLYLDGSPIIRYGQYKKQPHREILMNALREFDIEPEIVDIHGRMLPAPEGERYKAVGMGIVNLRDNVAEFFAESGQYGLQINPSHLQECQPLVSGIELVFEDYGW